MTFIDCFTSLDDIKGKDEGDPVKVLRAIMASGGRFSVFDATRTQRMARTMTRIVESGWVKAIEAESAYPWTTIELTDEGRNVLA